MTGLERNMTALLSKASPADSITSLADVAAERTQKTDVQTDGHGTHHCASCSKPAFNCCAACRNAPTDDLGKLGSTWYCGVGCQSEDWVHHKSTCKGLMARKILYRAGKTIQALFYVYRKVAFDKLIIRVEREGNSLILYEGEYLGQHEQCFIPFPATLLPDENEKLAVLTYLACGDAYMYMDVILKTMLEGISRKLFETPVKIKSQTPLKIRLFYANGTEDVSEYQHEVLLATLKDRSVYVVDLAGAQYGYYHEPVIPLATYQGSRAKEIRLSKSQPLGYQRQLVKQQCVDNGTWEAAIRNGHEQFYQCFNEAVETWQRVRMPLLAMLKLNDEEFLENQNSLVIHVEAHLLEYRKYAETHGHFKVQMIPHHVMGQGGEPERSERSFEDEVAELLGNAAFIDHEILDLRGMGF